MDVRQRVGNRIKSLRLDNGLSQEKLALISGVDRTYIAGVEAGRRNISIIALEKIIVGLNTTMSEFFSIFN